MFEQIYNTENSGEWDNSTFVIYMTLILFSFMMGWIIQHSKVIVYTINDKVYRPRKHINYFWFVTFFIVVICFSGLRDVGTDLPVYRDIFSYSTNSIIETYENEPGFVLANKIIHQFTDNANIAIFIFSFLSFYFVYRMIEHYADDIDISVALLAFVSMFYFQSFNLLRIYLVSYFLCYEFKLMQQNSLTKYALIVFFCIFLHYSAILMLLPILFYAIYRVNKIMFWFGIICIVISSILLLPYLSFLNIFERYSSYMTTTIDGGLGFAQILYHTPLFLLYFYLKQRPQYNSSFLDLFLVYSIFSFIYGCLGYKILVIGRMSIYFIMIYTLIIPYYLKQLQLNRDKYYYYIKAFTIIYIIFRCHMYFKEYLYSDSIMPYKLID